MSDAGGRAGVLEKRRHSPPSNRLTLPLPLSFATRSVGSSRKVSGECAGLGHLGTPRGSQPMGGERICGTLSGEGLCRVAGVRSPSRIPASWVFQFNPHSQWEKLTVPICSGDSYSERCPVRAETGTGSLPRPPTPPPDLTGLLKPSLLCLYPFQKRRLLRRRRKVRPWTP